MTDSIWDTLLGDYNRTNFSGAIDVIVVEREDGTRASTPFHVRFGRTRVLRSNRKRVRVSINGENVKLRMYLGSAGEAYFGEPSSSIRKKLFPQGVDEDTSTHRGTSETSEEVTKSSWTKWGWGLVPSGTNDAIRPQIGDGDGGGGTDNFAKEVSRVESIPPSLSVSLPEVPSISRNLMARRRKSLESSPGTTMHNLAKDHPENSNSINKDLDLLSTHGPHSPSTGGASSRIFRSMSADGQHNLPDDDALDKEPAEHAYRMGAIDNELYVTFVDEVAAAEGEEETFRELEPGSQPTAVKPKKLDRAASRELSSPQKITSPLVGKGDVEASEGTEEGPSSYFFGASEYSESDDSDTEFFEFSEDQASGAVFTMDDEVNASGGGTDGGDGDILSSFTARQDLTHPPLGSSYSQRRRDSEMDHIGRDRSSGGHPDDAEHCAPPPRCKMDDSPRSGVVALPGDGGGDGGVGVLPSPLFKEAPEFIPPVRVELSLCRKELERMEQLDDDGDDGDDDEEGDGDEDDDGRRSEDSFREIWEAHRVDEEEFQVHPELLWDPNLLVQIGEQLYPTSVAGPILVSYMAFGRPLPPSVVDSLDVEVGQPQSSSWWNRLFTPTKRKKTKVVSTAVVHRRRSVSPAPSSSSTAGSALYASSTKGRTSTSTVMATQARGSSNAAKRPMRSRTASAMGVQGHVGQVKETDYSMRSIRPTSLQLSQLPLRPGMNEIVFSVSSELRGLQQVSAKIFLWDRDSEVVISDIDGTITRSDVMGHIMPRLGRDWSHSGVAQLYSDISKNGYKVMYLTSRSIGQMKDTRVYIDSVMQDRVRLPPGPIFSSPDGLLDSFKREVVQRKPQEFKISCLKEILSTFGGKQAFYAGFGNRPTDVLSYQAVGIPLSKIFIINPQGVLTTGNMSLTYKSSYVSLNELVNQVFPSPRPEEEDVEEEYNEFQFWKTAMPTLEDLDIVEE